MPQPIDLHSVDLNQACYRNLRQIMPTGNAANYWRILVNETQMLFFQHPVNKQRRDKGLNDISSIWIWGQGGKVNLSTRPNAKIWANDSVYFAGLAKLTSAQFSQLPKDYDSGFKTSQTDTEIDQHLIVLDDARFQDEDSIESVFNQLEANWLLPILKSLRSGQISDLYLDIGAPLGFHIKPNHFKRFWRWSSPLVRGAN
jgi:hypothetical protein